MYSGTGAAENNRAVWTLTSEADFLRYFDAVTLHGTHLDGGSRCCASRFSSSDCTAAGFACLGGDGLALGLSMVAVFGFAVRTVGVPVGTAPPAVHTPTAAAAAAPPTAATAASLAAAAHHWRRNE